MQLCHVLNANRWKGTNIEMQRKDAKIIKNPFIVIHRITL